MEKEVVYVAELDSDVDDVVAAHYLFNEGVLKCVVFRIHRIRRVCMQVCYLVSARSTKVLLTEKHRLLKLF